MEVKHIELNVDSSSTITEAKKYILFQYVVC